jgi:tetratricopeptide (TPR) repeat protein
MRARAALAECLLDENDIDGAVAHFRALLKLNPNDNQGVRHRLLPALLLANRDEEAGAVLEEYDDEPIALWGYASVLLALRARDLRSARTRLRKALKANRRVPGYLTGQRALPDFLPPHYAIGSDDEAVLCAYDLIEPWSATADAVGWLRAETRKSR